MRIIRPILILAFLFLPLTTQSAVSSDDLPANTVWYMHADLKELRTSDSGRPVYDWFDGEVIVEVYEEIGIDIGKEIDRVTAFAAEDAGSIVIVEGNLSKKSQQLMREKAEDETDVVELKHNGMTYFRATDDEDRGVRDGDPLSDLEDGGFFSFALDNKLLITANAEQMHELLDNNGRVAGGLPETDAMFVLTADAAFVQAGMRPDRQRFDDNDGGWQSNLINNTESASMMISEKGGNIAVEVALITKDESLTMSLAGIVNGLIGLQAFNEDLDPDLRSLIANTRVEAEANSLSINTVITPDMFANVLEN